MCDEHDDRCEPAEDRVVVSDVSQVPADDEQQRADRLTDVAVEEGAEQDDSDCRQPAGADDERRLCGSERCA
jgi:hypothetical protein